MTGVRMDKWLWAARFFKTRAMASRACELGRVEAHGQPSKPAREVRVGEQLRITTEAGRFEVEVLQLSEVRGPAPVAQTLYRETEDGRKARLEAADERHALWQAGAMPQAGRPSKRDRRRIAQIRGR